MQSNKDSDVIGDLNAFVPAFPYFLHKKMPEIYTASKHSSDTIMHIYICIGTIQDQITQAGCDWLSWNATSHESWSLIGTIHHQYYCICPGPKQYPAISVRHAKPIITVETI